MGFNCTPYDKPKRLRLGTPAALHFTFHKALNGLIGSSDWLGGLSAYLVSLIHALSHLS
jgi:hypothetical protein